MNTIVSHEYEQTYEELNVEQTSDNKSKLAGLPRVLRIVGAISLFAAAGTFMLTEWVGLDSLYRYGSFLLFTLILGVAGIFCGIGLKEDKGARTLFAVATAIIPAHFAQLGALVYAEFNGVANVPTLFRFAPIGAVTTAITVIVATAALSVIARTGFTVLARSKAKLLIVAYMLANFVLLIPFRADEVVVPVALMFFAAIYFFDCHYAKEDISLKNFEGRSARLMLFAPYAVLVGRMFLYSAEVMQVALSAASFGALLFFGTRELSGEKPSKLLAPLQLVGALFVTAGSILFLGECFYESIRNITGNNVAYMLVCITPLAALSRVFAKYSIFSGNGYRGFGGVISTALAISALLYSDTAISAAITVGLGVAHIALGYTDKMKSVFFSGCAAFAIGIAYNIHYAADIFSYSPWLSLAILGLGVVISSSYLERSLSQLLKRASSFKEELDSWSAA